MLSDHQPANHQEIERSVIGEITEGIAVNTGNTKGYCAQTIISELEDRRAQLTKTKSDTVMFEAKNEHCAQDIISELEDARTQRISSESNTVVIEAEIHAENTDAHRRATHGTCRGSAGLLGCRIIDYTGTSVEFHTRHD